MRALQYLLIENTRRYLVKNFLIKLWKDESGAETVEWLVIVALLVAVAVLIYASDGQIFTLLSGLVTYISGAVPGAGG
jgi:Flp pilus assembly pilin Flp